MNLVRKTEYSILFVLLCLSSSACRKQGALSAEQDPRIYRDTTLRLEKCDFEGAELRESDADGDGQSEVTSVIKNGIEVCRSSDLNFDGQAERTTFFDASGQVRRIQSDYDREGMIDEIAVFEAGVLIEKQRVTIANGRLDTWELYEDGKLVATERDENADGIIDQWWEYSEEGCPIVHVDANGDGRADPGESIDYCPEKEKSTTHFEGQPQDSGSKEEVFDIPTENELATEVESTEKVSSPIKSSDKTETQAESSEQKNKAQDSSVIEKKNLLIEENTTP